MKKRKIQEEKRLLGAWVCDLANILVKIFAVAIPNYREHELPRMNHELIEFI